MQDDFDEQALISQALEDPEMFRELYDRYFKRIYAYVASRVDQQADAEDIVSEIFLSVVKNLSQLRGQYATSFAAWLFVIARNAVTDHYRRKENVSSAVPFESASVHISTESDPGITVLNREGIAQLRGMIAALPERKREIITLKYYGNLRNQEIAAVLQIGEKTVAAYLSRALDELYEKYTVLQSEERR